MRNPHGRPDYCTTAFFHHPGELEREVQEAGLEVLKLLGVAGPVWLMSSYPEHWHVPEKRALLRELLRTVEEERCLLAASAHPLAVACKQG